MYALTPPLPATKGKPLDPPSCLSQMYIAVLSIHTHPFLCLEDSHKTCPLECCSLTDSLYSMTPVPSTPTTLVLSGYTHSSSIQHPSFIPSIWVLCWIFPLGSHHMATPQCRRGGRGWASWVSMEAAPEHERAPKLWYGCSLYPMPLQVQLCQGLTKTPACERRFFDCFFSARPYSMPPAAFFDLSWPSPQSMGNLSLH